jgi:hypothetical protein
MSWLLPFVALIIWLASVYFFYFTVVVARRWYHLRGKKNPIAANLLRGPGHTLSVEREDHLVALMAHTAVGPVMPVFLYAAFLGQVDAGQRPGVALIAVSLIVGLAALGYVAFRIVRLVKRLRDIGLGFEAESAVGQELNWLMRDGFAVFHDVPGDKQFNVDHVVIGTQGVFAVETKGRGKPVRANGSEYVVEHLNGELVFPGWKEKAPIEQARRNARWLGRWLTSAVGEPIEVKPVLAIPGWWIERKSPSDVAIINSTNVKSYFTKAKASGISSKLVQQIVHQLDARCRDVETRAYKPAKDD